MQHLSTLLLVGFQLVFLASFSEAAEPTIYPSCHMHARQPIHFRSPSSEDFLEISIGEGECYRATMTIAISDEYGGVLYSYVQYFKTHVATHWQDQALNLNAERFVKNLIGTKLRSTSELPPHSNPEDYYEKNYETILIESSRYEALRSVNQPVFCHKTYYETWQCIMWNAESEKSELLLTGGY